MHLCRTPNLSTKLRVSKITSYSHVCLILSNSLILIFKEFKIEERIPRSLNFSFLFLKYYKDFFCYVLEKGRKGIHTGIIHISREFVSLKRAVWV